MENQDSIVTNVRGNKHGFKKIVGKWGCQCLEIYISDGDKIKEMMMFKIINRVTINEFLRQHVSGKDAERFINKLFSN